MRPRTAIDYAKDWSRSIGGARIYLACLSLEPGRQDEILTGISDSPFFHDVKRLTVEGYYRSEVGMRRELGFEGNTFLAEFEGCTHPEHRSWKVED